MKVNIVEEVIACDVSPVAMFFMKNFIVLVKKGGDWGMGVPIPS